MARLAGVFDIPIENIENMASAINSTSQAVVASVPEILDGMNRMAGSGKEFGFTADQMAGLAGVLRETIPQSMRRPASGSKAPCVRRLGNLVGFYQNTAPSRYSSNGISSETLTHADKRRS